MGELRIGFTESLSTTILPLGHFELFAAISARRGTFRRCERPRGGGAGTRAARKEIRLRPAADCDAASRTRSDDLQAEVLFDDELVIAAGSNTRWASRRNIDLAELVDEPWILPPPGTWYHAFVSKLFKARGLEVPKASLVTHSLALRTRVLSEGPYITTFARSIMRLNAARYALTTLPVGSRSALVRRNPDPEEPDLEPCCRPLSYDCARGRKTLRSSRSQPQVDEAIAASKVALTSPPSASGPWRTC